MDISNTTTVPNYTEDDCPLPELCDDQGGDNVGLAFGLTIAAGPLVFHSKNTGWI